MSTCVQHCMLSSFAVPCMRGVSKNRQRGQQREFARRFKDDNKSGREHEEDVTPFLGPQKNIKNKTKLKLFNCMLVDVSMLKRGGGP